MNFVIDKMIVFPVKGFCGEEVLVSSLRSKGNLANDRIFGFETGKIFSGKPERVNGKFGCKAQNRKFFNLRTTFNDFLWGMPLSRDSSSNPSITFTDVTSGTRFTCDAFDTKKCESAVSAILGIPVVMKSDLQYGMPDDEEFPGLTTVGSGTVEFLSEYFKWTEEETVRRFRFNLIIGGMDPFQEFCFLGQKMKVCGNEIEMSQACRRCAVPGADPDTGEEIPGFLKTLGSLVGPKLRELAPKGFHREEHGMYLAINTRLIQHSVGLSLLEKGDEVTFHKV